MWNDPANPGVQDDGEPGLAGVTVSLYQDTTTTTRWIAANPSWPRWRPTPTASTSSRGWPTGTYIVVVNAATLPSDFGATYDNIGTLDGVGQADISGGNRGDDG